MVPHLAVNNGEAQRGVDNYMANANGPETDGVLVSVGAVALVELLSGERVAVCAYCVEERGRGRDRE